jgi:hypothetical protein
MTKGRRAMSTTTATTPGDFSLVQLAGPGVTGMEHDVPLFHFDVPVEYFHELLADPADFFTRRLEIGAEQGIDMTARMDVTVIGNVKEAAVLCCYSSGGHSVCHTH